MRTSVIFEEGSEISGWEWIYRLVGRIEEIKSRNIEREGRRSMAEEGRLIFVFVHFS